MIKVKYLILGAGPSGLTFANKIKDRGENSFLVIEKEDVAGGLCRSLMVDGSPFDLGGGHFLDVRRPEVNEYLFKFMEEDEWSLFERDSRIDLNGHMVAHPLEANIWQLPEKLQEEYLESIKEAGCNNGINMPEKFVDWIYWKLGDKIASDYMIPYNQKMFSDELNLLGTYWLEKLPNVDYEDTKKSCEEHKAYGKQPGHARFYYPKKYGYGELWLRMADALGEKIVYGLSATELDINDRSVVLDDGRKIYADYIITTIPWMSFLRISGISEDLKRNIKELKYSSIETRYVEENIDSDAQWIYVPDSRMPYHRILNRRVFCAGSKGYWVETRKERVHLYENNDSFSYMNEYAYPINTIGKPEIMDELLSVMENKNIFGLGRWGEHSHYNSDLVVSKAMKMADKLLDE